MAEGMQCIVFVNAEVFAGDEDGSGSSKGDVALSITNSSCSDCCCRIVACSCYDFDVCRESEFFCNFWFQCSDNFPAFVQFRKLFFLNVADLHHIFGPAAVLYVKKQHTGCIRNICAERSGKSVCKVVFWKHDLCDLCKFLRLVFLRPQDLWCCEACKSDVCCVL